tara:strand:- start:114 stop:296 length:183 start_codon:yes stop_codon:yes gene_type:complete
MRKGTDKDIRILKLKLKLYLLQEDYEKAEVMKNWIIDLGGDPEVEDIETILEENPINKNK